MIDQDYQHLKQIDVLDITKFILSWMEYFDHFVTSFITKSQLLMRVVEGTHVTKFRVEWEQKNFSCWKNKASSKIGERHNFCLTF